MKIITKAKFKLKQSFYKLSHCDATNTLAYYDVTGGVFADGTVNPFSKKWGEGVMEGMDYGKNEGDVGTWIIDEKKAEYDKIFYNLKPSTNKDGDKVLSGSDAKKVKN